MRSALRCFRALARAPWYLAAAIGVVGLGLTCVIAAFAVLDGTLFKALPFPAENRLFVVNGGWSKNMQPGTGIASVSLAEARLWRVSIPTARFAVYTASGSPVAVAPGELVRSVRVDPKIFDVLGTPPLVGNFNPEDYRRRGPVTPVILSYAFWQRRFGADKSIIGRTVIGNGGERVRIVGLLPREFVIPNAGAEVLTPLVLPDAIPPSLLHARAFKVLVRLPAALTGRQASARLTAVLPQLKPSWPPPADPSKLALTPFDEATLVPIRESLTSDVRPLARAIFVGSLLLSGLAFVNVLGVVIARVEDRSRDYALRSWLGARPFHLALLVAGENAIIVIGAALVGIPGASVLVAVTARLMPPSLVLLKPPAMDARVLAFAAAAAAAGWFGVTIGATRIALRASLWTGHASARIAPSARPLSFIVSGQIAIATVIAVAGALVVQSLLRARAQPLGIPEENTAIVRMATPPGKGAVELEQFVAGLRQQPAVVAAAGINRPLLERGWNGSAFERPEAPAGSPPVAEPESVAVTTGFFDAVGLRPISGRLLSSEEIIKGDPFVVVSQKIATEYWPGREAEGQTLSTNGTKFVVVGVVPDIRYFALDDEPRGAIYWSLAADRRPYISVLILRLRTAAGLPAAIHSIKSRCQGCIVREAMSVAEAEGASIRNRQLSGWLFGAFSIAALCIIGVGVAGLAAISTARRSGELAIRAALGATSGRLLVHVLREQAGASGLGIFSGALVSFWTVRLVSTYMYRTSVYNLPSWSVAVMSLLFISLVAALAPAVRASRVDPWTELGGA